MENELEKQSMKSQQKGKQDVETHQKGGTTEEI